MILQEANSKPNRFYDDEDDGIKPWTNQEIKQNAERWSLAGDLAVSNLKFNIKFIIISHVLVIVKLEAVQQFVVGQN